MASNAPITTSIKTSLLTFLDSGNPRIQTLAGKIDSGSADQALPFLLPIGIDNLRSLREPKVLWLRKNREVLNVSEQSSSDALLGKSSSSSDTP